MKLFLVILFSIITLNSQVTFSQIENIQIINGVYTFLKEMLVKGIISFI
jgi:hypothetical protein